VRFLQFLRVHRPLNEEIEECMIFWCWVAPGHTCPQLIFCFLARAAARFLAFFAAFLLASGLTKIAPGGP